MQVCSNIEDGDDDGLPQRKWTQDMMQEMETWEFSQNTGDVHTKLKPDVSR